MSQERFQRLETLKAEIAEATELPVKSARVEIIASLRLQHETMTAELVAGNSVDPNALLALSRSIAEMTPAPPEKPVEVKVKFIGSMSDHSSCPQCGWVPPEQTFEELQQAARERIRAEDEAKAKAPRGEPMVIDGSATEIPAEQKALPPPKLNSAPKPVDKNAARDFHAGGPVKQDSHYGANVNPFLGGFSSKADNFGLPRTPSPAAEMD